MTIYSFLHERGIDEVYQATVVAVFWLVLGGFVIRKRVTAAGGGVLPDEGVSVRNILEVIVGMLTDLARSIMGDAYRSYFPVVGSLFFFILISNLMGMVPGVGGATSDVNTAFAWAIISFCVYNYAGIRTHGVKYIHQFMGPAFPVFGRHMRIGAFFFLPLEVILHFARIATLTIRLVANMFADHTIVAVWLTLVPPIVPAIFMGLGTLVAFLQAFVFALLTMIYIGGALEEAH